MARPRNEDRRNAILSAATRVIASQGLGAPTAGIAKEAGVSNGSLFVYFDTKATLLNELYVALKAINGLLSMPRRAHEWRELKRERAAHAALRDAHAEYLAARFNRASKAARQALELQQDVDVLRNDREFAGLAHLIAAA